jgi:muconolactone delta-isomerase
MKILALEREQPGATAEEFQPLLKAEAQRIWELQQAGFIREIYFDSDRHTAVIVLECPDRVEAQRLLSTLPLVTAKLIEFELIPLSPYDGLARLFAAGA